MPYASTKNPLFGWLSFHVSSCTLRLGVTAVSLSVNGDDSGAFSRPSTRFLMGARVEDSANKSRLGTLVPQFRYSTRKQWVICPEYRARLCRRRGLLTACESCRFNHSCCTWFSTLAPTWPLQTCRRCCGKACSVKKSLCRCRPVTPHSPVVAPDRRSLDRVER